jgi:hypothetical protein
MHAHTQVQSNTHLSRTQEQHVQEPHSACSTQNGHSAHSAFGRSAPLAAFRPASVAAMAAAGDVVEVPAPAPGPAAAPPVPASAKARGSSGTTTGARVEGRDGSHNVTTRARVGKRVQGCKSRIRRDRPEARMADAHRGRQAHNKVNNSSGNRSTTCSKRCSATIRAPAKMRVAGVPNNARTAQISGQGEGRAVVRRHHGLKLCAGDHGVVAFLLLAHGRKNVPTAQQVHHVHAIACACTRTCSA